MLGNYAQMHLHSPQQSPDPAAFQLARKYFLPILFFTTDNSYSIHSLFLANVGPYPRQNLMMPRDGGLDVFSRSYAEQIQVSSLEISL